MRLSTVIALLGLLLGGTALAQPPEPADIVKAAIDHWRGTSSYSEMSMTIHRPDWQRTMAMRVWTEGSKRSLVRVTAPKKDAGNGTLLIDNTMWTFSPKVNRIIKVPSSMMSQSWMGSDFSNKDISRADDIIDQYDHRLLETGNHEGHTVYVVQSTPHEEAAVVWGKEVLQIRDDYVLLRHEFWDQDGVLVKTMETLSIKTMGGRTVAARQRMGQVDRPEEWTEVEISQADFDAELKAQLFTQSNLRNPRE